MQAYLRAGEYVIEHMTYVRLMWVKSIDLRRYWRATKEVGTWPRCWPAASIEWTNLNGIPEIDRFSMN